MVYVRLNVIRASSFSPCYIALLNITSRWNKVEICLLRDLWAIIFTPLLLILVKFTTNWRKSVRKRSIIHWIVIRISLCVKKPRLELSTPYPHTPSNASGRHHEIRAIVHGCREVVLRSLQKWHVRLCDDTDRQCVLICSVLCKNRIKGTRNRWCNCPNVTFAKLMKWFIERNSVDCCGWTHHDLEGHDSYREASNTKLY